MALELIYRCYVLFGAESLLKVIWQGPTSGSKSLLVTQCDQVLLSVELMASSLSVLFQNDSQDSLLCINT